MDKKIKSKKILKRCKKAQKAGNSCIKLKITDMETLDFLRKFFPVTREQQKGWYIVKLL